MSKWTAGLVRSLQLLITVTILVYCVHSLKFFVKIRKQGVSVKGSFYIEKTKRLVECVYSCIQHTDCRSLRYSKTSAVCHLCSTSIADREDTTDQVLFANLKQPFQPTQFVTHQHKHGIVLERGTMNWHEAEEACIKDNRTLLQIDSDAEQAAAVKKVNGSGLNYVAIGGYLSSFRWVNMNKDPLGYSDWADGEPGQFDMFATLSKKSGYKWEAILFTQAVDGRLCES